MRSRGGGGAVTAARTATAPPPAPVPAVAPFARAEALDAALGDPWQPDNPYGFAAGAARDAAETYPAAAEARLRAEGFHLCHLPESLGGTLRSFEDTHVLVRVCARRDVNVMPATMFSISAVMTVLAAGTAEQHRRVAGWLRDGRTVAFGLSEEQAGSDVLANSCRLDEDGGLTGVKWLVGRGASADAAVVVARTAQRGPAAFTALLLGPEELADDRVRRLPARRTTGMRGIDFADLEFDGLAVPPGAVVGETGSGLAGALRAQQIVRLMSTAGCLATADTALRTALRFTREHRTGGERVADTPYGSRELALAAAELIATDVTVLAAARLVHVAPESFGLCSSVVKHVATRLTAACATRSRALTGARGVLREGPGAVLDKAVRDNAMVAVIDTSVLGNLRAIAMHLPAYSAVCGGEPGGAAQEDGAAAADRECRLTTVFAFGDADALPGVEPAALDLGVRPKDDILLGFAGHADAIAAELGHRGEARAAALVREVHRTLGGAVREAASAQRDRARSLKASPELLDLADRACLLYAAATAALTWWFHRDGAGLYGDRAPGGAGWLTAVLGLLTTLVDGREPRSAGPDVVPAGRLITELDAAHRLFTALPVRLSDGTAHRAGPDDVEDDKR
ncbi:alkylation response protein AidB-like acyl-CoA dehydrogenase [Streptomyces pristinaespiralis]